MRTTVHRPLVLLVAASLTALATAAPAEAASVKITGQLKGSYASSVGKVILLTSDGRAVSATIKPNKSFTTPLLLFSIPAAVSIHTVTAFLYVGLGGRPFWNSAIIAPRFLASAFAAGPSFIILTLQIVRRTTRHHVHDDALLTLRQIVQIAMMHPRTFVAQTTCAHVNHFYKSVLGALEFDGPAIVEERESTTVVGADAVVEHGVLRAEVLGDLGGRRDGVLPLGLLGVEHPERVGLHPLTEPIAERVGVAEKTRNSSRSSRRWVGGTATASLAS